MKLTDVIRRPLITEKTTILREDGRTLVLQVATHANKVQIRQRRRDSCFGSKVADVRTTTHARQDQAAGPLRRPPAGLEEGVRPAAATARSCRNSSRGPKRDHAHSHIQARRRPAARFQTVQVFDEITETRPHKPLTEPLKKSGGRNNRGEVTSWWRGGGHKRVYRVIDFKRDKKDIPGTVSTIEYDPNRSARIALVTYADGEKRYILQPLGLKVGDTIVAGVERRHPAGQHAAAEEHPARHADPQRGAEAGQGRADRALGRVVACSWWPRKASTPR